MSRHQGSNVSRNGTESAWKSKDGLHLEPIAIVGYSMCFPQDITTSDDLWDTMMKQRSTARSFPQSRMNVDAIYHPDPNRKGQVAVRKGHFLTQDLATFDAPFFAISTVDAAIMDPQHRLLLETTYKALENAGISIEVASGSKTSVYSGSFCLDWLHLTFKDGEQCSPATATGVQPSFNANRISWFFNFTGTSANIDTACSSSLVCLDLGCQGLRSGSEDMSIVTGSNVMLSPDNMHSLTNINMLSPDGQSYSFDSRGNGYSRGEGVGVLVLKRITDAIRDNDTIRGIIRSSGCNQAGHTPSITLSDRLAQEQLIKDTYAKAGLSMEPTRFFEAHGTGTQVGDPIEAKALGLAFREFRSNEDPLWVGALKSNIGHLEGASGIAGVIKTLLVLEKGIIPPNTCFKKVNHKIDTEFLRIKVSLAWRGYGSVADAKFSFQFPLAPIPWPSKGLRRASVNSFGNGGTNAHLVLDDVFHFLEEHNLNAAHLTSQDPPALDTFKSTSCRIDGDEKSLRSVENENPHVQAKVLVFSSNDEHGTQRIARSFAHFYRKPLHEVHFDSNYLCNLAYTLNHRRSSFPWRSSAVVRSLQDLQNLEMIMTKAEKSVLNPSLAFVFTGQGAQWLGMAYELVPFPEFQNSLLRSEHYLSELGCTWHLRTELFRGSNSRLSAADISQPACTAIQVALLDLLHSFGIIPTAVVGHSSGEIAAAYCAGDISHRSAICVAYYRGVLAGSITKTKSTNGAMMAVGVSQKDAKSYLQRVASVIEDCDLTIACINSPKNVTISGTDEHLNFLQHLLESEDVFAKKLHVNVAYHSPHMHLIADAYRSRLQSLEKGSSGRSPVMMFSSVTGNRVLDGDTISPDYWVSNLVSPVRFADALQNLFASSKRRTQKKLDLSHRDHIYIDMVLEIGPHAVLRAPILDTVKALKENFDVRYSSVLMRNKAADSTMLEALGRIYNLGYHFDLGCVNRLSPNKDLYMALPDLPSYAFDHSKQYWDETRLSNRYRTAQQGKIDLLGKPVLDWNSSEPRWRNFLRTSEMPWMEDHVVNGSTIYPGAGILVMVIEAASQLSSATDATSGYELKDVSFLRPLTIVSNSRGVETQLVLYSSVSNVRPLENWTRWRLFVHDQNDWYECSTGFVRTKYANDVNEVDDHVAVVTAAREKNTLRREIQKSSQKPLDVQRFYSNIHQSGLYLGPSFQRIVCGSFSNEGAILEIEPYKWPADQFPQDHVIHPVTLDALFHSACAGFMQGGLKKMPTMIPTALGRLYISKTGISSHQVSTVSQCARVSAMGPRTVYIEAFVFDPREDHVQFEFENLRVTEIADNKAKLLVDASEGEMPVYLIERYPDLSLSIAHDPQEAHPRSTPDLKSYLNVLGHKTSGLDILVLHDEDTEYALLALKDISTQYADMPSYFSLINSLCICAQTEVSLKTLESNFAGNSAITLKLANFEKGFEEQDFLQGSFHVVMLPSKIHLSQPFLNHVEGLLKGPGSLILFEKQEVSPNTSQTLNDRTQSLLIEQRFGCFGCFEIEICNQSDGKASRALAYPYPGLSADEMERDHPPVYVIVDPQSERQNRSAIDLTTGLSFAGFNEVSRCTLLDACQIDRSQSPVFVLLLELDGPFLYNIDSESFEMLKRLLLSVHHLVWISLAGGSEMPPPQYCMVSGLARALRSENSQLQFTTIAFESGISLSGTQVESTVKILKRNHVAPWSGTEDFEYVEISGMLTIPRVVPNIGLTRDLSHRSTAPRKTLSAVRTTRPLVLASGLAGHMDQLYFVEDEAATQSLEANDIEISIKAIGISSKDGLIALGKLKYGKLGQECAGEVIRVGHGTGLKVGDRVICTSTDCFRTVIRCPKNAVSKIPDDLPFSLAAAIPSDFGTAWICLRSLARLKRGETILIHNGASGIGQAAIQIAKRIGAVIYTTVSTKPKKDLLICEYQLLGEQIFYSRDTSFADKTKRTTAGRGVDVVISTKGGDILQASIECLAPYGRLVDISSQNVAESAMTAMLRRNISFHSFDTTSWFQAKPEETQRDIAELIEMFGQRSLQPAQPFRVRDISELRDVFEDLKSGNSLGKVVLEFGPDSKVLALLSPERSFQFDRNSTFVISGGLGGIGRATARWFVDNGVQNLVLLSRNGPRTDAAHELLDELRSKGANVEVPVCDITDLKRMQEVFHQLTLTMPPIKGCIQASIVARDRFFQDMTFDDWRAGTECKTIGSWNLHVTLPKGMDFFIILSSASGLAGVKGQTNYDAANTYEDALARYRVQIGEKATAFDLGAMVDDGILAENPALLNRVLAYGSLEPVTRHRYLGMLDYYCNPSLPLLTPTTCQVALGLGSGSGDGLESFDHSRQPLLRRLDRIPASKSGLAVGNEADNKQLLAATSSLDEACLIIEQAIIKKLSKSLSSMQDPALDKTKPLQMHGVDSLLAVELRNWIVKEFMADIAVFETQGSSTLTTLCMLVAARTSIRTSSQRPAQQVNI